MPFRQVRHTVAHSATAAVTTRYPRGRMPPRVHPPLMAVLDDSHPAPWQSRILIGNFTPFSEVDWPGKRVATVFLQGCPWRCGYCHNPILQTRDRQKKLNWDAIEAALRLDLNSLDGVVFSGGEPTVDRCLPDAIAAVKSLGLKVGMHTNGAYPDRLADILSLLDWVGFDLKTDYAGYDALTGARDSGARVTESARLILASGVDHEFRLTWHHELMTEKSALLAANFARHLGARRFVMQAFRDEGVGATSLAALSYPGPTLLAQMHELFADFELRSKICGLAHLAS